MREIHDHVAALEACLDRLQASGADWLSKHEGRIAALEARLSSFEAKLGTSKPALESPDARTQENGEQNQPDKR
jgi:hypothetical protein